MTELTDEAVKALLDGATPRFLIRKHGGYYRPNCQGYTSSAILAGRYTEAKAISETHPNGPNGPRDGMTYTSEDAITDEDFAAYIALREQRDDLARALLDARAELARLRADAAAAQALVVERAATQADPWDGPVTKNKIVDAQAIAAQQIKARIRALAPADGLAAVEALRVEIADLKMNMDADLRTMVREGQQLRTLAAELAAAQQREARLRAALEYYADTFCEGFCKDLPQAGTYQPEMDLDCSGCKARAALAPTPTDPGDGWTWNERLGWIGPDGKPADPRRRG